MFFEDDDEAELRRQAQRERTRFQALRANDSAIHREYNNAVPPFPWAPVLLVVVATVMVGRLYIKFRDQITLREKPAPVVTAPTPAPAPTEVPTALELWQRPTEAELDAKVKELLKSTRNPATGAGPLPVTPPVGSGGVYRYNGPGSAVDMPEMVRIRGQWVRKRADKTYRIKGETIYHDDRRQERK